MNKKIFLLSILFLIVLFSFTVSADILIDSGDDRYDRIRTDYLHLGNSNTYTNLAFKDDVYYYSYTKNVSGYNKQFIASSSNLINWTTQQMSFDASGHRPCQFYTDVDNDLICIWKVSTQKLRYWIMKDESDTWSTTITEWDESSTYDYYLGSYMSIQKFNDYIFINSPNSSTTENFINFQMNFDDGSYDILSVTGAGSSLVSYSEFTDIASFNIFPKNMQVLSLTNDFTKYHRFFSDYRNTYNTFYDIPTYTNVNLSNETYPFSWNYYSESGDIYHFYTFSYSNAGDDLYYDRWDGATELWDNASVHIGLTDNIKGDTASFPVWIDMIEGQDFLWGVYTSNKLRIFKISKADMLLKNDTQIGSLTNVTAVGNLIGVKNSIRTSSNLMATDFLLFGYLTSSCPADNFNCNVDYYIYYENVYDNLLGNFSDDIDFDCIYNYDCYAKLDTTYSCIENICVQLTEGDLNFTEGDVAFEFNSYLEEAGIVSIASKIFMGIAIIIVLNIIVLILFLSFGAEPNLIVQGAITLLALFGCAYLGLFPIWIIILMMIIGAGIIGIAVKGNH